MNTLHLAFMNFGWAAVMLLIQYATAAAIPPGLADLTPSRRWDIPLKGKDLRSDWCIGRPMARKISHPGCNSTEVKTKLCFGQCMTYFVHVEMSSPLSTCRQCTPSKIEIIDVKLKCSGGATKKKRVQVVKRCSCRTCKHAQTYLRKMRKSMSNFNQAFK